MGHRKGTDEDGSQSLWELAGELGWTDARAAAGLDDRARWAATTHRPAAAPEPDLDTGYWPPDALDPLPFLERPAWPPPRDPPTDNVKRRDLHGFRTSEDADDLS